MGIRDYLTDLTSSGAIRRAIGRAFRHRRRGGDPTVRVLLAIEDGSSRADILATLGRRGYAVTVASGAKHALELCRTRDLDVVLLDPTLVDERGMSLASGLRRSWPELTTVAVVPPALASEAEDATVAQADATVRAPFGEAELLEAIERALGGS